MGTQKKTKGHTKRILSLLLFVTICYGLAQGCKELNYYRLRRNWEKTTTPLSQHRIDVLCESFGLSKSHELCNGKRDVYGPDFYDLIQSTFKPKLTYHAAGDVPLTYEQVEKKIGEFKIGCEPMVWYEYEQKYFYECDYDLSGDGKYLMFISYDYPENTVYDIVARKGKEPHD